MTNSLFHGHLNLFFKRRVTTFATYINDMKT